MDLIIKSRNGKVSERQREYITTKLDKLSRYLDDIQSFKVEVSTEQRQDQGEVHRLQVTLVGEHGIILRADQAASDIYTTVDQVQNVLQRQIKRYKEKHWRRGKQRRSTDPNEQSPVKLPSETLEVADVREPATVATLAEPGATDVGNIVRVKEFALRPMFSEEAAEQMELLGHSFFVFRNAETERINVVYRRRDGNYGLIVPLES